MKVCCFLTLLVVLTANAAGGVVIHPAPADEPLSRDYRVLVNGHDVPVYQAPCNKIELGSTYAFASFAVDGSAKIEVKTELPLAHLQIRPTSSHIDRSIRDKTISFRIDHPQKLSIEPLGRQHPLYLFVDPIHSDAPPKEDAKIHYFGPGIHHPRGGKIELHSGETLHLADGAVVHAGIEAKDAEHIRIIGHGILDGGDWQWAKGPTPQMLHIERCKDVEIADIAIRASFIWTIATWNSSDVRIKNVKILGDRLPNDDGIDLCNTQHVKIQDCFIRTDDDCIAIKGMNDKKNGPTSDIDISDCLFWCDRARIVLMGHESQATEMSNIRVRNCDVLHYKLVPFLLEPGEDMPLKNVTIENIHINADGKGEIARLRPTVNEYMKIKEPGRIDGVEFKNITVENAGGVGIEVTGADQDHQTRNVTFDSIRVNDKILSRDEIKVRPFTENVNVRR